MNKWLLLEKFTKDLRGHYGPTVVIIVIIIIMVGSLLYRGYDYQ